MAEARQDSDAAVAVDTHEKETSSNTCEAFDSGTESTGTFSVDFPQESSEMDADAGMANAFGSCTVTDEYPHRATDCAGYATVMRTEDGATFTFDDGFSVRWENSTLHPKNIADGAQVYVTYRYAQITICPFCGYNVSESLAVTRTEQGDNTYLLFGGPAAAQRALKVSSRRAELCASAPYSGGCYVDVRRTYYENVLEFPDEVRVPYAKPMEISTPEGDLWLYWATSQESGGYECADGRGFDSEDQVTLVRQDWALP